MSQLRFQGRNYTIANPDEDGSRRVYDGASLIGTFDERDGCVRRIHPNRESDYVTLEALAKLGERDGIFRLALEP
jgi:hypothetical protein